MVLLMTLLLASCLGHGNDTPSFLTKSTHDGAIWGQELMFTGKVHPKPAPRPSALLGPYLAAYLSLPFVRASHAAVSGVLASIDVLHDDNAGTRDESYALLEELGLLLQVQLTDHLNRAVDRTVALDAYTKNLIDTAKRAQEHLTTTLAQRDDDATAKVRELRSQSTLIQRTLTTALRQKDYATASTHQSKLSDVQAELAIATADQKEIRTIMNLLQDSLDEAVTRVQAIDANRDALIAGIAVTGVPGADDVGVLKNAPRGRRTPASEDVFGPVQPTE